MKVIKYVIYGLIAVFILIQFIPTKLPENSTTTQNDIQVIENVPENIKIILNKSCYDCHSNQTSYPLYSYVAPVSWLIAKDTREGRDELNFSNWGELSKRRKIKLLNDIKEEVEERNMPLKIYTAVHREAVMTDEERTSIVNWTESLGDQILAEN